MGSFRRALLAVVVLLVAGVAVYLQEGGTFSPGGSDDITRVSAADLPPEARETLRLIDAHGPFPYPDHDGKVFGNREELLPDRPAGYYREYTVPTPGSDDRGARRIVTGGEGTAGPIKYYWTDDHYRSFERIDR